MLSSITPLGERGRGSRWTVTVGLYLAASTVAGGIAGLGMSWFGKLVLPEVLLGSMAPILLGILALAGIALDTGILGLPLPSTSRQVDRLWIDKYRSWVYGIGYGFQLGVGVGTIVTTSSVYLFLAAAMLTGGDVSALIGATFGLVRGSSLLLASGLYSPTRLFEFHARLERSYRAARSLAIGLQVVIAALLIGSRFAMVT